MARIATLSLALVLATGGCEPGSTDASAEGEEERRAFCETWQGWTPSRQAQHISEQARQMIARNYPPEAQRVAPCVEQTAASGIAEITRACQADQTDYAGGFMTGFIIAVSLAQCTQPLEGGGAPPSP